MLGYLIVVEVAMKTSERIELSYERVATLPDGSTEAVRFTATLVREQAASTYYPASAVRMRRVTPTGRTLRLLPGRVAA